MPPRNEQDDSTTGRRVVVPHPDPTALTTEQQRYSDRMIRELIVAKFQEAKEATLLRNAILETRLSGMDRAIELVREEANRLPLHVDEKITSLRQVHEEKLASVQSQFKERDTRSERESRDNKVAVDAAFAAQKEAAAKQDEANAKAIDKSEKATTETIKTNQELSRASVDAITKSLDEVKQRLTRFEGKSEGGGAVWGYIIGAVGLIAAVAVAVAAIVKH